MFPPIDDAARNQVPRKAAAPQESRLAFVSRAPGPGGGSLPVRQMLCDIQDIVAFVEVHHHHARRLGQAVPLQDLQVFVRTVAAPAQIVRRASQPFAQPDRPGVPGFHRRGPRERIADRNQVDLRMGVIDPGGIAEPDLVGLHLPDGPAVVRAERPESVRLDGKRLENPDGVSAVVARQQDGVGPGRKAALRQLGAQRGFEMHQRLGRNGPRADPERDFQSHRENAETDQQFQRHASRFPPRRHAPFMSAAGRAGVIMRTKRRVGSRGGGAPSGFWRNRSHVHHVKAGDSDGQCPNPEFCPRTRVRPGRSLRLRRSGMRRQRFIRPAIAFWSAAARPGSAPAPSGAPTTSSGSSFRAPEKSGALSFLRSA